MPYSAVGLDSSVDHDNARHIEAMPEHLTDLRERGAVAQHPGGETMAQHVGARGGWTQSRPPEGAPDHAAHAARPGQTAPGRLHAEEDAPRRVLGTILVQVIGQRFADIGGQRESIVPEIFAAHRELADPPVESGETQRNHRASAKAQTNAEEQQRWVSQSHGRRAIDPDRVGSGRRRR